MLWVPPSSIEQMFAPIDDRVAPRWSQGLNDRQREAVEHGTGPLLVLAGAGTGKTRTLVARVARLIEAGTSPDRILLLTFSRRAAGEMIGRASRLLRDSAAGDVWGGTFHAVGNRLLRRHGAAVGLGEGFTILDQSDTADLFGLVRADADIDPTVRRFPKPETIAAVYSRTVNAQEQLGTVVEERYPWCAEHIESLAEIFRVYTRRKREHNVVDFDDLLLYWRAALETPAGRSMRSLFDHVLVDEYQDTNRIQADILHLLAGPSGNVTVVGDDAQAIYSFRAATIDNIATFCDRFEGARVVTLDQSYRSTPSILAAANTVMAAAPDVIERRLWSSRPDGAEPELVTCTDEAAQAEAVCDRILELREEGLALREQCVLFRTGHHSAGLELELGRRDIPFVKFGGLRFLETAHVRDVVAMLRMVDNPRDELAWHRVLKLVNGIGPATARRIHAAVIAAGPGSSPLADASRSAAVESRPALVELEQAVADAGSGSIDAGAQIERFVPFCELTFPAVYDDAETRLGDVERLAALAGGAGSRDAFLAELVLEPPVSTSGLAGPPHLDDDYVTLSTIHSAKGGEWVAVYVIHATDGNIPSDMALGEPGGLDEERRILYVALTRAKDRLVVTAPQRYHLRRFGRDPAHGYAPLSRFLGAEVQRSFEVRTAASAAAGDAVRSDDAPGADPVGALLETLWG